MSALESIYPLVNSGSALPVGTTNIFGNQAAPPHSVNPPLGWIGIQATEVNSPLKWVVFRGVLYVTNTAVAATIQVNLFQGASTPLSSSPPLTVAANAVAAIPFELAAPGQTGGMNPVFGGGYLSFGINVTVAGNPLTLNSAFGHLWAAA